MKLELNTNGAWRTVLTGLGRQDKEAEDRYLDARTAADMLARISAATAKKPISWRLTSEADGRVIERCEGDHGWVDVAYDPERTA
jgi:hypothetical protein